MSTRSDRYTAKSQQTSHLYSDFLVNLNPHPVVKDVVKFVNEDAVNRAIKNLLLTDKGERLYQPNIGSNIRKMLFEPMSSASAELISSFVQDTIEKYEPRAVLINVSVVPNYDKNAYSVSIVYMVINKQEPVTLNLTLDRVR